MVFHHGNRKPKLPLKGQSYHLAHRSIPSWIQVGHFIMDNDLKISVLQLNKKLKYEIQKKFPYAI